MPISREPIIQEALANVAATTTSASESTTTVNKVRKRPQTSEVNASQHAPTRTETLNDPNLFRSHLDGIDQALNIPLQNQPLPSTDTLSLAGQELPTAGMPQPDMETLNSAEQFHMKAPQFTAAKTDMDVAKTSNKVKVFGPSHGPAITTPTIKAQLKGTWTRKGSAQRITTPMETNISRLGSRRKPSGSTSEAVLNPNKKPKLDEDTMALSKLFAKQLGSAVAAVQHCWVQ